MCRLTNGPFPPSRRPGEDRDVETIELTAEHFERSLEEVSPERASEFETGSGADEFDGVLEGIEAETGSQGDTGTDTGTEAEAE